MKKKSAIRSWIKRLCVLLLVGAMPLSGAALAGEIENVPPSCRVWINGDEITVLETAVSLQRYWTENPELTTAPAAIKTVEGKVHVEIEWLGKEIQSVLVRPLSMDVQPEIVDGRVVFDLPAPVNCVVEYNGQVEGALHLFLDAPDADKPDESMPNVRYFGPGVYKDVMITPRKGETIYLDEGSIVYGHIFCGLGSDFTIAGHGVLCGSIYDRYKDTIVPISLTNCSNVTICDITILDPSAWTLNLLKCSDILIDNVKIIGARSNSDGITMQNCRDITVQNCFVRSWDDSLVVKGYGGDVDNILFENCTLWTDLAQSCEIGYETRAKTMTNITFRNITVLHNFHKPVLSIHNSDQAAVSGILFENIIVEDAQMGEGDGTPYLIELTTTESQWSISQVRGTIRDVTIRNVQVLSGKTPSIRIWSNDAEHNIDDVQISNLVIKGERIVGFDQIGYEESIYNGKNITLE